MKLFSKRLPASIKKLVIPFVGVLVFAVFSSLILLEATKVTVDVSQDGETETIRTHATTVGDLVETLGVVVGEDDELSHGLDEVLQNGMVINYKQAKEIIVKIDDEKIDYATTADKVEDFLSEAELSFTDQDDISFNMSDPIEEGLVLEIETAYPVVINDGGKELEVWTTGDTVESLLEAHDITLAKKDKVKPGLKKQANEDTSIMITRVEKDTAVVEETIAYETEKRNDNQLSKGKEKVIAEGKEGTIVKTYEITLENGEEVNRELVTEEVKEASQNKVIAIGTKEEQSDLVTLSNKTSKSTNENEEQQPKSTQENKEQPKSETSNESDGEVIYMKATAYSADCNGCSGITATGINLKADRNKKVVAVDPNVIPLGSTVWVEGYGTAIAGDTGGAIKGNRIDIHVPTHSEAMGYGIRTVKVKVIK